MTLENSNKTRRDFIKTTLAGAGLAVLGLQPYERAQAGGSYSYLPPGFRPDTCKDPMLIQAFENMYFNKTRWMSDTKDILMRKGDIGFNLKENTPQTEPAYWFAIDYFNFKFQNSNERGIIDFDRDIKIKPKKNSNMWYWLKGNGSYFSTWVDSSWGGKSSDVELYLTKAIVGSAGLKGRDGELREAIKNLDENAKILKAIQQGLAKASLVDKKIAGWSSFILTTNEVKKDNNYDKKIFLNKEIEIPIRDYFPKIRAGKNGPYYHI